MVSKNTRGRPEKLTEKRKRDVVAVFEQSPNTKITKIYKQVSEIWVTDITKEIRGKYPTTTSQQLKQAIDEEMPGYDTIRNYYNETIKPNADKLKGNPLDKPWSLGASVEYRIPPEASKDLFDMWRVSLAIDRPISIRQARWIVHIRGLYYQPFSTGKGYSDKVTRNLELIGRSWLYSILERVSEIMGEQHFDTTNLDANSFMLPWERSTALKLGKVSHVKYSQEALAQLDVSLTGPSRSVVSVEQAVWQSVHTRLELNQQRRLRRSLEVLPEEDDLVSAYWLMYLSKGPLWNNLPPQPEVVKILRERRRLREEGHALIDSGGFPDDSMYSRQFAIRIKLREWVKKHSSMTMTIRDYYSLTAQHPALVLSPKLLSMVGYEVSLEDLELYAKLHENELKQEHLGWDLIPADIQQRFIHDEQTDDDLEALKEAVNQSRIKQEQIDQEFLELVQQKGGPVGKNGKELETFWNSIKHEWRKRYPEDFGGPPGPGTTPVYWIDVRDEYERLVQEHNQRNKNVDSTEGGTK